MTSHVGTIIVGGFLPEKEAAAEKLVDNTRQVVRILTSLLSKASPSFTRSSR
jgi:hypothetical protein